MVKVDEEAIYFGNIKVNPGKSLSCKDRNLFKSERLTNTQKVEEIGKCVLLVR